MSTSRPVAVEAESKWGTAERRTQGECGPVPEEEPTGRGGGARLPWKEEACVDSDREGVGRRREDGRRGEDRERRRWVRWDEGVQEPGGELGLNRRRGTSSFHIFLSENET